MLEVILPRTRGPLVEFMDCCHLQSPGPGGAPLVFGLYNAGHIWPFQGNEWLVEFTRHDWSQQHQVTPKAIHGEGTIPIP